MGCLHDLSSPRSSGARVVDNSMYIVRWRDGAVEPLLVPCVCRLDGAGGRCVAGGVVDDGGSVGAAAVLHQPCQGWLLCGKTCEECATVTQSLSFVCLLFADCVKLHPQAVEASGLKVGLPPTVLGSHSRKLLQWR